MFCKYIMALTKWNIFVKKVFQEGRQKNKTYKFKNALKDASRRKSEMNSMVTKNTRNSMVTKKTRKSRRKSRRSQ